jgi:hypothetical protein
MMEMTFSEHTERPERFKYGELGEKLEKILREQENNGMKTCLQQLTMLGKPQKG